MVRGAFLGNGIKVKGDKEAERNVVRVSERTQVSTGLRTGKKWSVLENKLRKHLTQRKELGTAVEGRDGIRNGKKK